MRPVQTDPDYFWRGADWFRMRASVKVDSAELTQLELNLRGNVTGRCNRTDCEELM